MVDNAAPKKLQVQGKAMSSPVPSLFPTLANVAWIWAERLPVPHGHQAIIEDKVGFIITSSLPMLKIDQWFILFLIHIFLSMLTCYSPQAQCFPIYPNSFDPHHQIQGHGHIAQIIFGESGKPCTAYLKQYTPI